MRFLKKLLIILVMMFGVTIAVGTTISIWYYRRVCDLDSRFYSPSAEVVVRLVVQQSFDTTVSFTVIQTKTQTTLEAYVLPDDFHWTFSYVSWKIGERAFEKIIELLEKSDVPSMTHMRQLLYCDGSTWDISVSRNGTVEKASIRCPDASADDARKMSLVELGKLLNEYAGYIIAPQRLASEPSPNLPWLQPNPTQVPAETAAEKKVK